MPNLPLKTDGHKWAGHREDALRHLEEMARHIEFSVSGPTRSGNGLLVMGTKIALTIAAIARMDRIAITENNWLRARVQRLEARVEELEQNGKEHSQLKA